MLGRHAAVEGAHHAVQLGLDRLARTAHRGAVGGDVQVAVAHMAKEQRVVAGPARVERSLDGRGEAPDLGLRQADVEVHRRVHLGVQLGRGFAQLPQRLGLGLRLGDHGIHHLAGLHGVAQGGFHGLAQAGLVLAVHVDQRQQRVALRQRGLQLLPLHGGLHEVVPHQLERGHAVAETALHALQHGQRLVKTRQGHQGRGLGLRQRAQAQQHAGDHAQRALGADEELLEVIARVVLEHGAQHGQHRAVGQHHFQAQHLLAHHAVLQHAIAAGIGGHVATDLAAAARAQVHAERQSRVHGGFLHGLQRGPGLHRHGGGAGVDGFDRRHALQRQRHTVGAGHGGAGQAGQAALGHHGHAVLVAQAQGGADVFGAAGADQGQRSDGGRAAPVGVVARGHGIAGQDRFGTQGLAQGLQKFLGGHDSTFHCPHCAAASHPAPAAPVIANRQGGAYIIPHTHIVMHQMHRFTAFMDGIFMTAP